MLNYYIQEDQYVEGDRRAHKDVLNLPCQSKVWN